MPEIPQEAAGEGGRHSEGPEGPASPPGPRLAPPTCACGCGEPARPGSKYADYERCRQRAHKRRVRAALEAAGLPATLTLETARRLRTTRSRSADAPARRQARQTRRPPRLVLTLTDAGGADRVRAHLEALAAEGFDAAGDVAAALAAALERRRRK